jgi:F0F1-type ATP synthase assembly protein I
MEDHYPQPPQDPYLSSWRRFAGMGTEFAGALCGLTLLGYWIDRHFGSGRKATLICASIGLVGGMYNFIRQAIALSKETEAQDSNQRREQQDNAKRDDADATKDSREP